MRIYLVSNKSDDYGNQKTELVETTKENAEEYYYHKAVPNNDVNVLRKYIDFVSFEEEKDRLTDYRFYGN